MIAYAHEKKLCIFLGNPKIFTSAHSCRTAQISLTNYNKMKLVIAGDPGATVGSTINFNLLTMSPTITGKEPDKFYSGKYLITAVRHSISMTSFQTVLEIVKESVSNEYISPKMDSVLWKNTVKGIV